VRIRSAGLKLVALLATTACFAAGETAVGPQAGEIRIVAAYPHDPDAFTQGLAWHDGRLFESVGRYGHSSLREVEIATGRVVRQQRLPPDEFGEGLALAGERWVQLTWREQLAHLWSRDDLADVGRFAYRGEGWGLTFDGKELVMSDGGATLSFRSATDFSPSRTLAVTRAGRPEAYLNELEWADGAIYANIWQSDEVVRIDPASGAVTAVFDAGGLLSAEERRSADVLNGIAWSSATGHFFLTGKLWPKLFEVELVAPSAARPPAQR